MGDFAREIAAFAHDAEREMEAMLRNRLLELFGRVVDATPVLSGRAKGNWICSIGSPANGESGKPDRSGEATKGRIAEVLKSVNAGDGADIFLVNNTPYIEKLEYGGSEQAPNGMTRLAIQAMEQKA